MSRRASGGLAQLVDLPAGFILRFFAITLPAFKIAGGILIFTIALHMIHARQPATQLTPAQVQGIAPACELLRDFGAGRLRVTIDG